LERSLRYGEDRLRGGASLIGPHETAPCIIVYLRISIEEFGLEIV
jgi:hypothetical protein